MIGPSKRHLGEAGESYFQHLRFAFKVGGLAIGGGVACLIHAVVPALFTTTASRAIQRINALIDERRPD